MYTNVDKYKYRYKYYAHLGMIEFKMYINLLGNYCRKMVEKKAHTEENRRSNIEALYGFYASSYIA